MFVIDPIEKLVPGKDAILQRAALLIQDCRLPGQDTEKHAAVIAVSELAANALADVIEDTIAAVLSGHEMIEGDFADSPEPLAWSRGLDDAVCAALAVIEDAGIWGDPLGDYIQGAGVDNAEVAREAARALAALIIHAQHPEEHGRGKWLARFGIVKADLDALASGVHDTARAPDPASAVRVALSPPIEGPSPAGALEILAGQSVPTREAIAQAYTRYCEAGALDLTDISKRLGVSRGTLSNWAQGKTPAKCSAVMAQVVVADIHRRMADLSAALDVFGRVVA